MNKNKWSTVYTIIIQGYLKDRWIDWLNGMVLHIETRQVALPQTSITVGVPDQAALRGILNKLWDLNLTLIALNLQTVDAEQTAQGGSHENQI